MASAATSVRPLMGRPLENPSGREQESVCRPVPRRTQAGMAVVTATFWDGDVRKGQGGMEGLRRLADTAGSSCVVVVRWRMAEPWGGRLAVESEGVTVVQGFLVGVGGWTLAVIPKPVVEAGVAGAKVMGKVEGIVRRSGGVEGLDGVEERERMRGQG